MGTSTRNKGQSGHTPLIPSWLDEDELDKGVEMPDQDNHPTAYDLPPISEDADPNRFRGPRTTFTQYLTGKGRDKSAMRKAVSRYVRRSLGGSGNATKRLGAARGSTARLFGVLNTLSGSGGVQEIARQLSLDSIQSLSATKFFLSIASFICPDGGPNDEGMVRSAYFDTIADNQDLVDKPIETLTSEECVLVLQHFMCKVIMEHVMNDIANKLIVLPDDVDLVIQIEDDVEQMIKQSVSDAFVEVQLSNTDVTDSEAQKITDQVYIKIYSILESLGD